MPFTGSHPAAVLPFFFTPLVPAALVIGSMIPDLPYFVPVPIDPTLTHSTAGVLSVDLLLGLGCFAIWVWLMAPAAVAIAGDGVRRRLAPGTPAGPAQFAGSARNAGLVVASVVVGAATHVVWDAFTHPGRWGARHVGWLEATHAGWQGTRYAQYGSGLFGAAVLATAVLLWWRRTPPAPVWQGDLPVASARLAAGVWAAIGFAIVIGAAVGAALGFTGPFAGPRHAAFLAATVGGASGAAVALAFAGYWRIRRSPARSEDRPG